MIKRDKEGHYIMVKGLTQQEELMILNIMILDPMQEHKDIKGKFLTIYKET